jgi:hypothetical protein
MSSFDLAGAINGTSSWLYDTPLVNGVVNNPIFTAMLLTAIVAIIGISIYHKEIKVAGNRKALRATLYIFISAMIVSYIHHYATVRHITNKSQENGIRDVFSSIQHSRTVGSTDGVPIYPKLEDKIGGGPPIQRQDNVMVPDLQISDVLLPGKVYR